jgi:hypothetical protein
VGNQRSTKADEPRHLSASEIIEAFFRDLKEIEGMNPEVVEIIQDLWSQDRLGKDELLTALRESRSRGNRDGNEED